MTGKVDLVGTDDIKTVVGAIVFELIQKIYFNAGRECQKINIFRFFE